MLQTPLDVTWHHFTIQKDSKMVLGSQGFVERRSEGQYKVSGGWGRVWWSWVVLWSVFLRLPLVLLCQWWDPCHFLMWLVAPKALQIKMSECYGHFAIFWSLEQHFGAEVSVFEKWQLQLNTLYQPSSSLMEIHHKQSSDQTFRGARVKIIRYECSSGALVLKREALPKYDLIGS